MTKTTEQVNTTETARLDLQSNKLVLDLDKLSEEQINQVVRELLTLSKTNKLKATAKHWLKSKTIRFNLATLFVGGVTLLLPADVTALIAPYLTVENIATFIGILSGGQIGLRAVTNTAITTDKGAK